MNTMSTETILSAVPSLSEADLARAQRELRDGHLLVVPTDTVYGIGADAANPEAVAAVLAAKGRGRQMPPPVLVASVDAIDLLCVDIPEAARALARAFWPGGLTLILRARPDLGWDLGETGGTIGVRMPNQPTSEPMGVSSLITPQSWPAALPVLSYQTWLALAVRKRLSAPFWPGVKVMLLPFLLRQCPAVTTVSAATSEPVHRPVPPACVV